MHDRWERASSALLTLAAIVIAGVVVLREFGPRQDNARTPAKAAYDDDWRQVLPLSRATGPTDAPIAIVEFSDFECPFCRRFHNSLRSIQRLHPGKIAHSFAHYPSPLHQNAMRAARAAECAAGIHRFPEAVDLLFAHQEALSDEHWPWFLPRVARTDSVRLVRCMADTVPMPLVDSSVALGRRMKIMGTPTIFLNGWRYPGAPTDSELSRAVSDLLAGRRPYASFPETAIDARALFRGKN